MMQGNKTWKGIFRPALLSKVKSDIGLFSFLVQFVWQVWTQQSYLDADWNNRTKMISVRSKMTSGEVCLRWDHDPTSIWPNYKTYSACLS